MKSLILLASLLLPQLTLARLGETVDECKARYGQPTGQGAPNLGYVFTRNGFKILALFNSGKCDLLAYQLVTEAPIDSDTIETLLARNQDPKWPWFKQLRPTRFAEHWRTQNGQRLAGYIPDAAIFLIATPEGFERFLALTDPQKSDIFSDSKPNLDGL